MNTWWSFWAFREIPWNLGSFSFALFSLGTLYVASNALVPRDREESLQTHFFANRTVFFTTRGLLVLNFWVVTLVEFGVSFFAPARLVGLLLLMICVVGIASSNRRTQAILAILGLAAEVFAVGYLRYSAGSLGLGAA